MKYGINQLTSWVVICNLSKPLFKSYTMNLNPIKLFLFLFVFSACIFSCQTTQEEVIEDTEESYTVIVGEAEVGNLAVQRMSDTLIIDFEYQNNGRGPKINEQIILDSDGFPVKWKVTGNTTFGNQVDETFQQNGKLAKWTDATGTDSSEVDKPSLYISQFGSPYSISILAQSLMSNPEFTLPALPGGRLSLNEMELIDLDLDTTNLKLVSYALSGADLDPEYFLLDEDQKFFAYITPRFIIVREGYESKEKYLRSLSEKYSAERFEKIQAEYAHQYDGDVRIQNVRVFNPKTLALSELSSVVVREDKILSIEGPTDSNENETIIDGKGGTLVAGLYDMHAHMGDDDALMNVLAGVTSVRDMGNDNKVLDSLIWKIESGVVVGPRITRMGFIEGKSEYKANGGIIVNSEEEAVKAVETYADMNFYGIKSYNSMKAEWVPAMVKRADELGMPVMGHVPAFSNANTMIRAGFDEMTHINQVMLGWVLEEGEDTRTLLRLTALQRLPDLDLSGPKVQETLDLMVKNKVAMDPTLAIHEVLLLARNGETMRGTLDYIDHMPANVQRNAKVALAKIENEEESQAYIQAYDKIVETLKMMRERGVFLVPGTDLGGAFALHRELELYGQLGYSNAELLKLGSYDMAQYLGHEDRGEIAPGKLADFFLIPGNPIEDFKAIKTISMVSKGGVIYYPTEVYPTFGIEPFTEVPEVSSAF